MRRIIACLWIVAAGCTQRATQQVPSDGAGGWQLHPPAPTERTEVAAASVGAVIYVIGGFNADGKNSAIVEVFETSGKGRWSRGPDLPHPVDHAMAAAVGERVFLFGGSAAGAPTRASFELTGDRWVRLPDMPEPRSAGGAAVVEGKVVIAGGVGRDGLARSSMLFDPEQMKWSMLPGLAVPREHLGVAAAGGRVYAVGGRRPGNVGDVEWYQLGAASWTSAANLPTPRGGMAAAGDGSRVFAVGGEDPTKTFDEVETLSISTDGWSGLQPITTPRHGVGVVISEGRLWVLCGGPKPGLSVSGIVESLAI